MSTAKRFENRFKRASRYLSSDDFNYWLKLFRAEIRLNSKEVIRTSPESYDSPWDITFNDDSKGYLGNPYQRAFEAFFYAC